MFDATSKTPYANIPTWFDNIQELCGNIPIVVLGNRASSTDRDTNFDEFCFDNAMDKMPYFGLTSPPDLEKPLLWFAGKFANRPFMLRIKEKGPACHEEERQKLLTMARATITSKAPVI